MESFMGRSRENVPTKGQTASTVVLWLVLAAIVPAAIAVFAGIILAYGSVDNYIQLVIQWSLQARYDRIIAGQPLWPWTFWIFFWGFVALLVLIILVVLYVTLLERKLIGYFQIRLGPNRVGPWGILQPFADMIKLLVKEDIVPRGADKWLHLAAPVIIFVPTLLAFVVIPFGAGTVELPQQLVAPTFDQMWVDWIGPDGAKEQGWPGPGYIETGVAVEENKEFHKTWWIPVTLEHEPLFVPTNPDGVPLDARYKVPDYLRLQIKPADPKAQPVFDIFYRLFDLGTPGRSYDVLEVRFEGSQGHEGIIELGLQGEAIDSVEEDYSEVLAKTGPDVPLEERFDFGDRPPSAYIDELFSRFADAVAINDRKFGPANMVPAFGTTEDRRASLRDLYTPDWKNVFYIHGAVDRNEKKASLYFFPPSMGGDKKPSEEYDTETIDWRSAGATFRLQRVAGGGYRIETADGNVTDLAGLGDSARVRIGDKPVTLKLKNTQYYNIYIMGKDLGVGILYILAVTSIAVLVILMAGFGSNNKWSLYGALRSAAQLMSYEIPMTLAILGPVLMAGTLSTVDLVESQRTTWFVIPQFLAFYIFLVCMTSEVNRTPFDLPEAESELVAGFHTEYSGLKFGFFYLAEYANVFLAAAFMTILFFGGWKPIGLPFVGELNIPFVGEFVSSFIWFMLKCVFWVGVLVWFRATFPRFRIDQMMDYAWKVLLPLALLNIIFVGAFAFSDWNFRIWQENNWRFWELYIKPLFVNVYTSWYAVPVFILFAILFLHATYSSYLDRKHAREREE